LTPIPSSARTQQLQVMKANELKCLFLAQAQAPKPDEEAKSVFLSTLRDTCMMCGSRGVMELRIPSTKRALCGPCTSAHPQTKDFYVRQGRRVANQVMNHPSLSGLLPLFPLLPTRPTSAGAPGPSLRDQGWRSRALSQRSRLALLGPLSETEKCDTREQIVLTGPVPNASLPAFLLGVFAHRFPPGAFSLNSSARERRLWSRRSAYAAKSCKTSCLSPRYRKSCSKVVRSSSCRSFSRRDTMGAR
jgi:hypothetical protein